MRESLANAPISKDSIEPLHPSLPFRFKPSTLRKKNTQHNLKAKRQRYDRRDDLAQHDRGSSWPKSGFLPAKRCSQRPAKPQPPAVPNHQPGLERDETVQMGLASDLAA
ncbi:MAG: hypothetical protein CM1200mP29_03460 [Verrucomicrobiota bacterium]|nr:MAG: hypothetical protein CM1200mP29_03460 [Verrucomicrobiota bacterium]